MRVEFGNWRRLCFEEKQEYYVLTRGAAAGRTTTTPRRASLRRFARCFGSARAVSRLWQSNRFLRGTGAFLMLRGHIAPGFVGTLVSQKA